MKVIETKLNDCLIIQPEKFSDERGYFLETYQELRYKNILSKNDHFVQDNLSRSKQGVLRGLHFQKRKPQGKLVRVSQGEVFDVAVDLRSESSTFGQWFGVILNDSDHNQLWIPPGFAHGFLVLSELADFEYKCTEYYDLDDEEVLVWNDPQISISWPLDNPIVSNKDRKGYLLKDLVR